LLIQGMPALVAGGTAVVLMLICPRTADLQAAYLVQGAQCVRTEQFDEAFVCFQRLLEFDPSRDEFLYGYALAAQGKGYTGTALSTMRKLAPEDHAGYGLAHLWLGRRLFLQLPSTPEETRIAERHPLLALDKEPDLLEAHVLLTNMYVRSDR